jgi:hypothetical protein
VTRGGAPIAAGTISFLPEAGNTGPAATSSVVEGEYRFSFEDGPIAGPHRVLVTISGGSFKETFLNTQDVKKSESAQSSRTEFESTVEIPAGTEFVHNVELGGGAK